MLESNSVLLKQMISSNQIFYHPKTEVESITSESDILKIKFNNGESKNFNAVVAALGTDRPVNYLNGVGIQLCYEGSEIFTESSLPGVFAVGDVATKAGGTINLAFNSGVKAFKEAYNFYISSY